MAGPGGKKRHVKERRDKPQSSSDDKSKSPEVSERMEKLTLSPPPPIDGNRDPGTPRSRSSSTGSQNAPPASSQMIRAPIVGNKNLDAGAAAAFRLAGLTTPPLPPKPSSGNRTGREIAVKLNAFQVGNMPSVTVYQYDVAIEEIKKPGQKPDQKPPPSKGGSEKKTSFAFNRLIWESDEAREKLHKRNGKEIKWIYDKAGLAWTNVGPPGRWDVDVNADAALGKEKRAEPKMVKLIVTRTKTLDFAALESHLAGKADWSDMAYETLNFLDHLMRERPSKKYTQIKRNFFARGQTRAPLGGGVEAFKGVYSSVRPVSRGFGIPGGLSVNVDVANTTFWIEGPLHVAIVALFNVRDPGGLAGILRVGDPQNDEKKKERVPSNWKKVNYIKKLRVYFKHLNDKRPRSIEKVMNETAITHKFDPDDETISKGKISVADFFLKKHKVRLQYPNLPLVKMAGGAALPMEQCIIIENQRYGQKLSERQTAEMIKFAVTPPAQRWQSVQNGIGMLDWQNDDNLREYGLKISTAPTTVKARVLINPKVLFGARSQQNPVDPKTYGRWDLRGKTFIQPHKTPLDRWGVCVITSTASRITPPEVQNFLKTFISVFKGHGGQVVRNEPLIMDCANPIEAPGQLFNAVGRKYNADPQLLMFVVPTKDAPAYGRIKRECDCSLGIASQVLLAQNVQKAQAQYCSNVSMKVNAKLGGWTAQASGVKGAAGWFSKPTMVIGADVSHAAPGASTPSIAAITMSWDTKAIKYIAAVESNGFRTEMVSDANFDKMLGPMIKNWTIEVSGGRFPQHIIYVRDGVSEGQYPQVLNGEVQSIRRVIRKLNEKDALNVKLTVVVVTKRHHVRFFPEQGQGDKNGNPLPGTLVETGMTSPFNFDFLLCAHSAIKGTARPAHYHVLLDEEKMKPEELQQWIYESSYQYVRSTTPVSLFPAAYYADLAAGRAVCHAADWTGADSEPAGSTTKSGEKSDEVLPLLPMPPNRGIRTTMWFV